MEQNKSHSSQKKSEQDEKEELQDIVSNISLEELNDWIKELNSLECYIKNDLKFNISFESQHYMVDLIDKNGHRLQEYLPVQFKALYLQLKKDKADSKKGTILNLNC
jgi:uncharacterized FlaG/YvyC family protein